MEMPKPIFNCHHNAITVDEITLSPARSEEENSPSSACDNLLIVTCTVRIVTDLSASGRRGHLRALPF